MPEAVTPWRPPPQIELDVRLAQGPSCEIWLTTTGEVVITGDDKTDEYDNALPHGVGRSESESMVLVDRTTMLSALRSLRAGDGSRCPDDPENIESVP